jgi:hypothetical protein
MPSHIDLGSCQSNEVFEEARHLWLTPGILATAEAEVRIAV